MTEKSWEKATCDFTEQSALSSSCQKEKKKISTKSENYFVRNENRVKNDVKQYELTKKHVQEPVSLTLNSEKTRTKKINHGKNFIQSRPPRATLPWFSNFRNWSQYNDHSFEKVPFIYYVNTFKAQNLT